MLGQYFMVWTQSIRNLFTLSLSIGEGEEGDTVPSSPWRAFLQWSKISYEATSYHPTNTHQQGTGDQTFNK